ncbi:MAG: hypothetical protein AAB601_00630 [Patescibacteria group bacterium]
MGEGYFILFEGLSGSGKTTQGERLVEYLKRRGVPVLPLNREPTTANPFGVSIRKLIKGERLTRQFIEREFGLALVGLQVVLAADEAFAKVAGARAGMRNSAEDVIRRSWRKKFCQALSDIFTKLLERRELTELEFQFLFLADRLLDLWETILPALKYGKWVVNDRFDLTNFAVGDARGVPMDELYRWHENVLGGDYRVPDLTIFVAVPPRVALRRLKRSGKPLDRYETLEGQRRIEAAYHRAIALAQLRSVGTKPGDLMRLVRVVNGDQTAIAVERDIERLIDFYFFPKKGDGKKGRKKR